jgi:transcriptional regulator with XRE-family HTH domain
MHGATRRTSKATPTDTDIEVGKRIKWARVSAHISQHELGRRIDVSANQIQKYETAINRVSAGRLDAIAKAIGRPVTLFIPGAGDANGDEHVAMLIEMFCRISSVKAREAVITLVETLAGEAE